MSNWASNSDSWLAARVRIFRMYRGPYHMGFMSSVWRSLYTWFLWNVYDVILYRIRTGKGLFRRA